MGDVAAIVSELFDIKHKFVGKTLSTVAHLSMDSVVEDANDKHLPPWAELCRIANINNTPLSPYAAAENLSRDDLWLDNSKLMRETGFQVTFPKPTTALLQEILEDFTSRGLFPSGMKG